MTIKTVWDVSMYRSRFGCCVAEMGAWVKEAWAALHKCG